MDGAGAARPRRRRRAAGDDVTGDLRGVDLETARAALAELFDLAFYRAEARLGAEVDAFAHYFNQGASLRPNVVFDPGFYRAPAGVCPLLHYAVAGEPADVDPSALFDVAWYRRTYGAERPLAHYLARRFGPFSPHPDFDAAFYLAAYPDIAAAGMDPWQHYLAFGFRDFRKPSAGFNPKLYANRHMAHERAGNPVVHLRTKKPPLPPPPAGAFEAVRAFAKPGLRFEPLAAPSPGAPSALALAFHLPQFHRLPENDEWWGEGFTEWTLLARGQPRFAGHYQPRIPGALGFYDLTDRRALAAQAARARGAGIGGFVFYHYDFGGRRLLQGPVETFLKAPEIDIGFCLMWANENWTRRWDGTQDDVLIAQDYDPAHEPARLADFARHFRDPRYIRLQGRPLLMIYRASLIPEAAATLARWRRRFEAEHGEQPVFVMAQTFDDLDPRPLGFDGAIEFPPHKLTRRLPQIFAALDVHDPDFEADVFAYDDVVAASLTQDPPAFPLIQTAVPCWDNDARRQGRGLTLAGATPLKYERWLAALVERAQPLWGTRLVAINAWNEWSEGAYLEPDVHFGSACLNATARALYGRPLPAAREIARVSAFVLHEGGPFPPGRLRSVFAQTHPLAEIVVLDRTEDSLRAVEAETEAAGRDVALGLSVGDPLAEAAAMAQGEFVWLSPSHGRFDPRALAMLAAALRAEPRAACAVSASQATDGEGRPVFRRPNPLVLETCVAYADGVFTAPDFLARQGGIPEAVLWRRESLAGTKGDVAALTGGAVVYVHDALNFTPA